MNANRYSDAIEFGEKVGKSMWEKYHDCHETQVKAESARILNESTAIMSPFYGRRFCPKVSEAVLKGMRSGWKIAAADRKVEI